MIKKLLPLCFCLIAIAALSAQNQTATSNDRPGLEIFKVDQVDEAPRFPGCEDLPDITERKACADKKMLQFVYENIKYPGEAREKGIQGMAVVNFVIDVDGFPFDPVIKRSLGFGIDEEVLRLIGLMQEQDELWIPAKKDGNPVRTEFNLPVRFKLE